MKYLIVLFLLLALTFSAFARDDCFMEVRFFKGEKGNLENMGMVSTYMCDREQVSDGIFYMTKDIVGITSNSIIDVDSTQLEVHFSLKILLEEHGYQLTGNVYTLSLDPVEDYMIGVRKNINQPIRSGKATLIRTGSLSDETPLWMEIKTSGQPQEPRVPSHPVILKTVFEKSAGNDIVSNSISEIVDNIKFQTSTSFLSEHARASLGYQVLIHIDSLPKNFDHPYATTLKLIRRYNIMRKHFSRNQADAQESYQSTYSKIVELEKGKTIKIVFPPDSPSEHEIRVTDTLIIRP